ncbi:hypothetical protein ACQ0QQ_15725 [Lysinibacillus sphaericus]
MLLFKSIRILEIPGFKKEGMTREALWLLDHYEDIVTYSIFAKEGTQV